jgi:hypothetical protein
VAIGTSFVFISSLAVHLGCLSSLRGLIWCRWGVFFFSLSFSFAFVLVLRFGLWGGEGGDRIDSEMWVGGMKNEMR